MFKRTREDFVCEHCGEEVRGNGYTNHCPQCLWSKHVDIEPGDRLSVCQGPMKPVAFENISGEERIMLRCLTCTHERPNKIWPEDNRDVLVELSNKQ